VNPLLRRGGGRRGLVGGGALSPLATVSRPSAESYLDAAGAMQQAPAGTAAFGWAGGVPRLQVYESRTNHGNTSYAGAVNGASLTGQFATPSGNGITLTGPTYGFEDGMPYAEVRWQGTATSSGTLIFTPVGNAVNVAAVSGETWTGSLHTRLVGGSLANLTGINVAVAEYLNTTWRNASTVAAAPGAVRQRHTVTRLLTMADTDRVQLGFNMSYASGAVVDATLRFHGAQIEKGHCASPWIPTSGPPVTRAADGITLPAAALFPAGEGTVLVKLAAPVGANSPLNQFAFQVDDGGDNNRVFAYITPDGYAQVNQGVSGGLPAAALGSGAPHAAGQAVRLGVAFRGGRAALCAAGGIVAAHTVTPATSAYTHLRVGQNGGLARALNSEIELLAAMPAAVPDAVLKAMVEAL
jgi:hypothetical protein